MMEPAYAFGVSKKHFTNAKPWIKKGFTVLELGPGDSLISALNMTAFGAKKCYMVDIDKFATDELEPYKKALSYLEEQKLPLKQVNKDATTLKELFENIDMEYLTDGLNSLSTIPDNSVDLIWSHAVLEHVKVADFDQVMREFSRILKPNGVCSHVVDLKDHFEESLNNLRFSDWIWESNFFSRSGFYTNRLRHNEIIQSFENASFNINSKEVYSWETLPMDKSHFNKKYQNYSNKDLLIYEFDVILTKQNDTEPAYQTL